MMIPIEYFIRRSRYSHVIYLSSLGETYLFDACRRLTSALGNNIVFKLEELGGDKWDTRKLFLERYGYGRTPIPGIIWKPFRRIYFVRNFLVHQNGDLGTLCEKERDDTIKKLKNVPGIKIEDNQVVIESSFIADAIKAVHSFIVHVNGRIHKAIDPAIRPRIVT